MDLPVDIPVVCVGPCKRDGSAQSTLKQNASSTQDLQTSPKTTPATVPKTEQTPHSTPDPIPAVEEPNDGSAVC